MMLIHKQMMSKSSSQFSATTNRSFVSVRTRMSTKKEVNDRTEQKKNSAMTQSKLHVKIKN